MLMFCIHTYPCFQKGSKIQQDSFDPARAHEHPSTDANDFPMERHKQIIHNHAYVE